MSVPEHESYVEHIWRDVSGIEYAEARPRVKVSPTNLDFLNIGFVSLSFFLSGMSCADKDASKLQALCHEDLARRKHWKGIRSHGVEAPSATERYPQVPCVFRFISQSPTADPCKYGSALPQCVA